MQQPDPTLPIGQTRVSQDGVNGTMTVTYRQRIENGAEGRPHHRVRGADGRADARRSSAYGTYADPHWDELAECESGGRWDTVDPTPNGYDGGLGIYVTTWMAFGGAEFAPNAGLATREQQIIVGQRIYDKMRLGPVGLCEQRAALAAVEHVTFRSRGSHEPVVSTRPMAMLTPATVHALLDEHGLHPKRSLGQHFLADPNTARRVVALGRSWRRRPRCSRSVPGSAR